MGSLLKGKAPVGTPLTAVEDDPEVIRLREAHAGCLDHESRLTREWKTLADQLNPYTASTDHRIELTMSERIRAEERQRALVPLIRLATADIPPAAEALAAARRRAYAARYDACRARVAAKLERFYRDLEALARGAHADLRAECDRMNACLTIPGATMAGLAPPPFDPLMLCWPELREDPDGPVTQRRQYLAKDGWL